MVLTGTAGFGSCLIWTYRHRERGNNNNGNDITNNYDNSNSYNIRVMLIITLR